jgi:hypothetical protein
MRHIAPLSEEARRKTIKVTALRLFTLALCLLTLGGAVVLPSKLLASASAQRSTADRIALPSGLAQIRKTPAPTAPANTALKKKTNSIGLRRRTRTSNQPRKSTVNAFQSFSLPPQQDLQISEGERVTPGEFIGDLSRLPQAPTQPKVIRMRRERERVFPGGAKQSIEDAPQSATAATVPAAPIPTPSVGFKGLDFNTWGAGWPPDTVGDVGPNHYVQAVNTAVGIYSKTGTQLAAFTFDTLFAPLGAATACGANQNAGDPTVVFDRQGGHWFVSDFAFADPGGTIPPFYQCIAVSKGNDPVTSGWWLYAIRTDDVAHPWFADYPKMGIWPDALYMTANMFDPTTYREVRVWAFNRADLEAGLPVRTIIVDQGSSNVFGMLPGNLRGLTPPAARENILVSESATLFAFEMWKFKPDFITPASSTFTGPTNVSQTSYNFGLATATSPANNLDSLEDQMMMQAQYRRLGNLNASLQCVTPCTESIWVNHTVRTGAAGTPNGIQWAQINVTGGTIVSTPVQQQIYGNLAADGVHRWLGSLAVDSQGNMALGYSASRNTVAPDIRYVGRLGTDPLSTLPQTETTMLPGITRFSQSGSCGGTCIRWGDYSAMSVDPADDCTFWYTNEYYEADGLNWQTRIGSFKFPSCNAAPTAAPATISGSVITADGTPLAGVTVNLGGALPAKTITDSAGNYRFDSVDTDNFYTVSPSLTNYHFSPDERSFSLLANKTDAVFTGSRDAVLVGNAIDTSEYFIRQHYLDFLGREPDEAGFNFWSKQMLECNGDARCFEERRINVSAAYFLSIEFQETGGLIDRLYRASFGRAPLYAEFIPDSAAAARSVVVGRGDWSQQLATNKQSLIDGWVERSGFKSTYEGLSKAAYVDKLIANTRVTFTTGERDALVNSLADGSATRASVLRRIVEDERFVKAKLNEAFVMMEYFGYLRRDPDESGYKFWLQKLNEFHGNFVQAEMVKAFINSAEYRQRFVSR